MNIKSLLIGSAAALVAVSGAQAADAIVAAEPEPMEYVRVCDAFGTGFFYIPGTETCLQIGGEVRFGLEFGRDENDSVYHNASKNNTDWDANTRVRLHLDARNDTEYGTLQSYVQLEAYSDSGVALRQAYIDISGLRVGYFNGWWDDDIAGESDVVSNVAKHNSIRYTYDGGSFQAGLSIDEIDGGANGFAFVADPKKGPLKVNANVHNDVGVSGMVGGAFGGVNVQGLVAYDNATEEWAARGIVTAEVGPGTLGVAAVWASDANEYYAYADWSVAASYAIKATEKLTITPAVSYFSDLEQFSGLPNDVDAWGASLKAEYQITTGLKTEAAVTYLHKDVSSEDDQWGGFVRLYRSF